MSTIYDRDYYESYLKYLGTESESQLNSVRSNLLSIALLADEGLERRNALIVDYGCSYGAFLSHLRVTGLLPRENLLGVEINPYCIAHCIVNDVKAIDCDMFGYFYGKVDIMTFWDVFEHLPNPAKVLQRHQPSIICLSLPCLDAYLENCPGKDIQLWKHWKPLEHLWNFTQEDCKEYLANLGYEVFYESFDESKVRRDPVLGEKNIMSFIAKRM